MSSKLSEFFQKWNISCSQGGKVDGSHVKEAIHPRYCGCSYQSILKYQAKNTAID